MLKQSQDALEAASAAQDAEAARLDRMREAAPAMVDMLSALVKYRCTHGPKTYTLAVPREDMANVRALLARIEQA